MRDKPLLLVVDDDPGMRLWLRAELEQEEFVVEEAENGNRALEAVGSLKPDLMLLDVMMPGKDGFQTCAELRAMPEGKRLPVLVFTGLEDTESIDRAYAVGATAFAAKPINGPILAHQIRYMLRATKAFDALAQSEARLADAQRIARLGNWDWQLETGELFWSDEIYRIFGLEPQAIAATYEGYLQRVHPDDREAVEEAFRRALAGEVVYSIEHRILGPDGSTGQVQQRAEVTFDGSGRPLRMMGTVHDVTEQKKAEKKLRLANKVFEGSGEMIVITDSGGRIVELNPAALRLSGFSLQEVCGRELGQLSSGSVEESSIQAMQESLGATGQWQGELLGRRKSGETFLCLATVNAVKNEQGETTHFVATATDISALKDVEDRLQNLAHFDPLTGLPNRNLFRDRFSQAILNADRNDQSVTLAFLGLDRFKDINYSLGHRVGDRVLVHVAELLKKAVRGCDTLARLSGDEFALVFQRGNGSASAALPAHRLLDEVSHPLWVGDLEICLSASLGIALCPQDGMEIDDLIRMADTAMNHAKGQGGNRYHFYSEEMNIRTRERLTLQAGLRRALDNDEFVVHYQPKCDKFCSHVMGMEALVRWQHPEQGMIPPGRFIPVAEETGLIVPIGERVLTLACEQTMGLQRAGFAPIPVAVNLSARQFREKDLVRRVCRILDATGLAPEWLHLEITESALVEEVESAIAILKELKEMGVRVAIDDFGTGYSSLGYLKRFPIDFLKIDQSFVRGIPGDEENVAIVRAIIAMAKSLQMTVIAEGVETQEQLDFLRNEGSDQMQGYFISRPVPVGRIWDYMALKSRRDVSPPDFLCDSEPFFLQPDSLLE